MQIISGNILLIDGPEGISLYIERATSCITDEWIVGAVQTALTGAEAAALANALLKTPSAAVAVPELCEDRKSINAALAAARAHAKAKRECGDA